jgi:hypothetical protein
MEQPAVKLLYVVQGMLGAKKPLVDGEGILEPLFGAKGNRARFQVP